MNGLRQLTARADALAAAVERDRVDATHAARRLRSTIRVTVRQPAVLTWAFAFGTAAGSHLSRDTQSASSRLGVAVAIGVQTWRRVRVLRSLAALNS